MSNQEKDGAVHNERLEAYFREVNQDRFIQVLTVVDPDAPAYEQLFHSQEGLDRVQTLFLGCTIQTFRPGAAVEGVSFVALSSTSSLADIQEGLDANARGFDPQAPAATEAEAEEFRGSLRTNLAFTAKLADQPVGAGMFTFIIHGFTEAAGITTLEPFRQRGIGAAVTSEIVRAAFEQGADTVLIRTDNPIAYRIYRRLGFQPLAMLITSQS